MQHSLKDSQHLLQKYGVLIEFDIINVTSLEDFIKTYDEIANSSDDISELKKVSKLLTKSEKEIPGFIIKNKEKDNKSDNPELNKIGYALIEFIMKKTQDPSDWAYIITYVIDKLGLEFSDSEDDNDDT
jgi:hypothetical protein|tara:strand:+ start:729 stop:1115 length:387 start_codon:yes stop_codon:yes gene_type:complete